MRSDELSNQSLDFAVSVINLVKELKAKHESVISNQIGRSSTSIGANIREAQYAHGTADFIAKLQIALKEANETISLKLLDFTIHQKRTFFFTYHLDKKKARFGVLFSMKPPLRG